MGRFASGVEKFKHTAEQRLRIVSRTAVQSVVAEAQRTRGQGGRMRVDTGFLRASIQAAVGSMPSGKTTNDAKREYPVGSQVEGTPVAATLLRWDPNTGQPIYVGWTAIYARPREYKDGFLRGAVENWDKHVRAAARKVDRG